MPLLNFKWDCPRIQASCRRLKDAYDRKPGHEVPVFDIAHRLPVPDAPPPHTRSEMDRLLYDAVAWANGIAAIDQDWPPMINTLNGVPHVPQAFGCKIVYAARDVPWAQPALGDIMQVYHLKPTKPGQTPLLRLLSEWIDYAQRKLGTEVPFWTMDLQSPFSLAEQILGPDLLFTSMYDHPKALHHLLQMATDYSIEMLQWHIAQMEHPGFPGRNFPSISQNIGICLADDTPLIMLGPDHYREFALPYNSQIARAFGAVHIHSCGNYAHNLDNLLAIPGIRSIQLHAGESEFPLPASARDDHPLNRARQRVTYLVDFTEVSLGDAYRGRARQMYEEYVLPRLRSGNLDGLILQGCGPPVPGPGSAVDWVRQQVARGGESRMALGD
jgi:hypothetical protein